MSAQERKLQLQAATTSAEDARLAEMHKALQGRQEALDLKEAALAEREAAFAALQSTQQAWCVDANNNTGCYIFDCQCASVYIFSWRQTDHFVANVPDHLHASTVCPVSLSGSRRLSVP